MANDVTVRWGWLKAMYLYTIIGAGGFGLGILLMPATMRTAFGWPSQDPIVLGVTGSVYFSFALLSVLGLRSPLKFSPVLLLELVYKTVWLAAVIVPLLVRGEFPAYGRLQVAIFSTYIIGDLIAIPFAYLFGKTSGESR